MQTLHLGSDWTGSVTKNVTLTPPFLSTIFQSIDDHRIRQSPESTVKREFFRIFGTEANLSDVAAGYFATIHQWMPMISKKRFYERLELLDVGPCYEVMLLACSMYLIIQVPADADVVNEPRRIYQVIKHLVASVESADLMSIELVQSKLLVSLFEIGHALYSAAYISIGACARIGIVLGINEKQKQSIHKASAWTRLEEEKRLWWGIVITDRFINLIYPRRPFAAKDPICDDYLPVDDGAWDRGVSLLFATLKKPLRLSTPPNVRVSPFAREAQVASLLGRVLGHVYDPTPNSYLHQEVAAELERSLNEFAVLLHEEASMKGSGNYCGPSGMCHSARMILHRPDLCSVLCVESDHISQISPKAEALATDVALVAVKFNASWVSERMDALVPFIPHCIYQAAMIQVQLVQQRDDRWSKEFMHALMVTLSHYEKRWKIAGMSINSLFFLVSDAVLTTEQGEYIRAIEKFKDRISQHSNQH